MERFQDIIRHEMEARMSQLPGYTQADFARFLDMKTNRFSEILHGKHGLSKAWAVKISDRLGWQGDQRQYFLDLVDAHHARSPRAKREAHHRLHHRAIQHQSKALAEDVVKAVSDWYHFALLELLEIPTAIHEPSWLAKRLGLNATVVDMALSRLMRLKLIEKKGPRWQVLEHQTYSEFTYPSDCAKNFHRQILKKAEAALIEQTPQQRTSESYIVAVDQNRLSEIDDEIKEFLKQLVNKYGQDRNKNEVYAMTTQLFQLTSNHRPKDQS